MKLCFLIVSILTFTFQVKAEEAFSEAIYRNLYEALSGKNCDQSSEKSDPKCKQAGMAKGNRADLQNFSEDQFFGKLANIEMARLKCGQDYWRSLSSSGAVQTKEQRIQNQQALVTQYNKVLPTLNDLKSRMDQLKLLNTALHAKIVWAQTAKDVAADPGQAAKRKEYFDREAQIQELVPLYELAMSQLPHSDMPKVRKFIEDQAGPTFFRKEVKPMTVGDMGRLADEAMTPITDSIGGLAKQIQANNFSTTQRESLATDGYLLGELSKENPDLAAPISKYQCLAQNRATGKKIVNAAADTALVVATVAAPALGAIGRMAFVAKFPRLAVGIAGASRAVGYANVILNSYSAVSQLADLCFSGPAKVESCSQTPKTILAESTALQCVMQAAMHTISLGATYAAKRMNDRTSELYKFLEKMKANSRATDYPLAGTLSNTERVAVSEMILGRDFSDAQRKALLAAHEIGKGIGQYTPAEIEEKRRLLTAAGFSNYERELLMYKGLAGKMGDSAELAVQARGFAAQTFGRSVSAEQAKELVDFMQTNVAERKERLENLKAAGFSAGEIDFISKTGGRLNEKYTKSADEVANVATTAATAPKPVVSTPPPPPPAAPVSTNPMVVDPSRSNVQRDLLYSASEGSSSVTQTSARMYLEQYGKANNIAGANADERRFKTMEAVVNNTVKNIEDAKKALTTVSPGGATYNQLQKNLPEMKKRCQGLTNLARTAGMTGAGFLSGIDAKIKAACGN